MSIRLRGKRWLVEVYDRREKRAAVRDRVDHWLYRCYSAGGDLLYVGVTNADARRLSAHAASRSWAKLVTTIRVEHFPTREEALAAEREAIRRERPGHNVQHAHEPASVVKLANYRSRS